MDALKGVARSFLAESMLMFPVKPPVFAGRRRPISRFFVAPESSVKVHSGRPLASGVAAGAVPSTVAPAGGVNVAFRSAAMPTLVTRARSTV